MSNKTVGVSPHIALLGDSVFDNGAYIDGEDDVAAQLRKLLPAGWRLTSVAVDGATTTAIPSQLRRLPEGVSNVVVSIGGNDALQHLGLLTSPLSSTAVDVLSRFAPEVDRFARDYRQAITAIAAARARVTVCTIYNGRLERHVADAARMAVAMFNDVILRTAVTMRLGVIELRDVCAAPSDYANPIEPSANGGLKIAKAILAAVG